jgi:RND family efflux transporter MFP subunit
MSSACALCLLGFSRAVSAKGDEKEPAELKPVTLSPAALVQAGIKTAVARKGQIAHTIELTGAIAANQDRTVHMNPKVEGLVRKVYHTIGDTVKAGEPLAQLDSTQVGEAKVEFLKQLQEVQIAQAEVERKGAIAENTAKLIEFLKKDLSPLEIQSRTANDPMGEFRGKLLPAYASARLTRAVYQREQKLYERKVSSEKEFLEARKEYETAQTGYLGLVDMASYDSFIEHLTAEKNLRTRDTAYQAALRRLEILGTTPQEIHDLRNRKATDLSLYAMKAPIDGTVTEKHVTLGEKVTPETSLFTLVDLSEVWALADVYEKDLGHVHTGMQAIVEATAYPGQTFSGKAAMLAPMIDPKTRTSRLRIVVDNAQRLLSVGMFVKVQVTTGQEEAVVAVPVAALQDVHGKTVVFVRESDTTFRPRPVVTGPRDAKLELVEITSGLKEGDTVITSGSFFLKSELQKGEAEEE